ncbi:MAG: IS481 family transposase [Acidimicrobiia bacterium]|nr:IS481 family transposase [Acidimicrobiia bacterium]MCY4435204.1 IS481 family transposase [bacterium]
MSHANARFTPMGRLLIVQRVEAGMAQAHVAAQMGLSRATVAKWWRRWVEHGEAGLVDRSSRPHRSPRRTDAAVEAKVCRLRRQKRWGPARIAARLGVPASTVHRILVRNGLNRLSWLDRPTGRVIRRYERPVPGDLVHLDVKKVGKIPPGGGWRAHGRANTAARGTKLRPRVGYSYLHVAIDDHSRLAYVEALDNETADTLVGFFERARVWFRSIGVAVDEIITDNGPNFRSKKFAAQLAARAIAHTFTRPYRPQTNGKAERFNRTLTDEFLYSHKFRSEPDRRRRLQTWIHHYNLHRHHTAINGTPSSRVHNLYGSYS